MSVENTEKEEVDFFSMSDEDFAKVSLPEEQVVSEEIVEEPTIETTEAVVPEEVIEDIPDTEVTPEVDTEVPEVDVEKEPTEIDDTVTDEVTETEPTTQDTPDSTKETSVDYVAEYSKLMAPFKANGADMQVDSVDDAIQLMKMGAGYHKKMSDIKPAIRTQKLLEKSGITDETKLNYILDLYNKKPEAIQKLLKDSNIDPLDIDVKADNNYTPTTRKVSDTEIALDEVINTIRDTPTYKRTLNVVSKDWDETSQNSIATEPQIIATINGHMQDGTFDAVTRRVDYERSLGRLTGVPDFQAYMQIGNVMADEGKLYRKDSPSPTITTPPEIVQPATVKPSKAEEDRKTKKRAASPTVSAKTTAEPLVDPFLLSDEEFAKLDKKRYINPR